MDVNLSDAVFFCRSTCVVKALKEVTVVEAYNVCYSATGSATGLQLEGRRFDCLSELGCVTTVSKLFTPFSYVIKQYNLVPV